MKSDRARPVDTLKPRLRTKIAQTDEERAAHFAIRREVFVDEQKLFEETDLDEHDKDAIPIICTVDDAIGGTVRVYPLKGAIWVGGRLAVRKAYRTYLVGPLLVKKAVKTVKERGCTQFLAHIQPQNVRFFQRLGWRITGEELEISGVMHAVMEADLGRT